MLYKQTPVILSAVCNEQSEIDCACPAIAVLPGCDMPDAPGMLWQLPPNLYRTPLPDNHLLAFNPSGTGSVAVLNKPARTVLESFANPRPVEDITARRLAELSLLQPEHGTVPVSSSAYSAYSQMLTAWLHVTDACNLDCAYCYLQKSGEAMDETTARAAVEAVFRSAVRGGFQAVKLKYAGGEPTLNFRVVQSMHECAAHLSQKTGITLNEAILSNGVTLTPRMLDFISGAGIRLSISIDGVGAAHDSQRATRDGRGSFEAAERGIYLALDYGVKPYLSITVTKLNAFCIADVVAFALELGLPFNLNFCRDGNCVEAGGGLSASNVELIDAMKAVFAVVEEKMPPQSLISSLVDRASFEGPHLYPCGAGHNYMVIDQRGRVARCHMEIDHPVTDVSAADPLAAVRSERSGFQNIPVDEKDGCRDCEWRYWCAGGCPLVAYRATGTGSVKSSYCSVYKHLYPEVLRLEGLRLLKWHGSASSKPD